MFRRTVVTALAAVALLLTSCAAEAEDPAAETGTDAHTPPTPGATPQAFLDREPLPSCGEFTMGQGEPYPAGAMECVEDAIGAGGAELVLTMPTVEGDPVVTWYRGLPTGGMETWSDVRQDTFAGEGVSWHYSLCPSAVSPLQDPGECTTESFE